MRPIDEEPLMNLFPRIGVLLNGTSADETALRYGGLLAKLSECESLLCVVAADASESDAEPLDAAALEQQARDSVPPEVRGRVEVRSVRGSLPAAFLRVARDESLDLVIKGRELPSTQMDMAAVFARVARKSPCNALIVPQQVRPHLSRLLVPVDFSEHARLALDMALKIARASRQLGEKPQVVVQSVFRVGYGYAMTGVSFSEAARRIESATDRRLDEFLDGVDTSGVQFERICTCSEHTAHAVHDLAAVRKMDMIVIGSRGLSRAAAVILGSNAERILAGAPLPVLLVKRKGETVGLLNVLLGES